MAGRPKKKPEYNPELQFNNFLQELRDAYEEAASLRSLADELNISLLKLRKLLITADVFTSDICTEINNLHQSGKKISEIMKKEKAKNYSELKKILEELTDKKRKIYEKDEETINEILSEYLNDVKK